MPTYSPDGSERSRTPPHAALASRFEPQERVPETGILAIDYGIGVSIVSAIFQRACSIS